MRIPPPTYGRIVLIRARADGMCGGNPAGTGGGSPARRGGDMRAGPAHLGKGRPLPSHGRRRAGGNSTNWPATQPRARGGRECEPLPEFLNAARRGGRKAWGEVMAARSLPLTRTGVRDRCAVCHQTLRPSPRPDRCAGTERQTARRQPCAVAGEAGRRLGPGAASAGRGRAAAPGRHAAAFPLAPVSPSLAAIRGRRPR